MAYYIMFNRYDLIPLFFTEWSGRNSILLSILEKRARVFDYCPYVCPSFYAITFYSIDVLEI